MNLSDEEFFYLGDARERATGERRAVFAHREVGGVNLVENLLEPEFVSLVDCDEEKLVVVRGVGQARLQVNQLAHAEVLVVG